MDKNPLTDDTVVKKRNLKVLFIPYTFVVGIKGRWFWPRNLGQYLDGIACLFDKPTVLCRAAKENDANYVRDGESIYSYEMKTPVRVVPVSSRIWKQPSQLIREILNADNLILFIPGFRAMVSALICILFRKPYIFYIGAPWNAIFSTRSSGKFKLILSSFFEQMGNIFISRALFSITPSKEISDRLGGSQNQVYLSPSAVLWGQDEFFRRENTCLGEQINVLYIGAFRPHKGIDVLVEGFSRAYQLDRRLRLTLVGAGSIDYEHTIREMVNRYGLTDLVHFTGYIADPTLLQQYYRSSDIFLLPTLSEGFPRVVYEAMSQGLPVVTTQLESIASVLHGRQAVCWIKPGSPDSLTDALLHLVKDPSLRRELIHEGYLFARERMHPGASILFFEQIYDQLTKNAQ